VAFAFADPIPRRARSVILPASDTEVAVSIVVPVRNEADNIAPLIAEIAAALDGRWAHEIIYVNDGSTDATAERLAEAMKQRANLRELRHARSTGQSAAVRSGARAARGAIVATLDGDGQNNPAFLPDLISAIEQGGEGVGLAAGQRVGRKDTGFKKLQSRVANGVRNAILKDGTRDTGCGLKAFRREVFLMMPYFDGLHRFLPALVRREGYEIVYVDVVDRPRHSGVSNYGFFDRLWIGILDLFGVWWLIRRKKPTPVATEVR
jgi:dolichol-phosphate mannosyltransferase